MALLCLGRGTFVWCGRRFKTFGGWVYQGGGSASNLFLHLSAATDTKLSGSVYMQIHVHVLHLIKLCVCVFHWVGKKKKKNKKKSNSMSVRDVSLGQAWCATDSSLTWLDWKRSEWYSC